MIVLPTAKRFSAMALMESDSAPDAGASCAARNGEYVDYLGIDRRLRALPVAPIMEIGARRPSRRAELRGHLPQNAFAQNSMLPQCILSLRCQILIHPKTIKTPTNLASSPVSSLGSRFSVSLGYH